MKKDFLNIKIKNIKLKNTSILEVSRAAGKTRLSVSRAPSGFPLPKTGPPLPSSVAGFGWLSFCPRVTSFFFLLFKALPLVFSHSAATTIDNLSGSPNLKGEDRGGDRKTQNEWVWVSGDRPA